MKDRSPTPPISTTLSESAHPRVFRTFRFVYPVLSRRAGGISVGINLNPDKACNFDCIYCQVDRNKQPQEKFVALDELIRELEVVLNGLRSNGALWQEPEFSNLPENRRFVADLAFSGDGEPTTFKNFSEVVCRVVETKEALGFIEPKVVLITNASGLHRPDVEAGLAFLDRHRGEVWAKLDAGTAAYFKLVDNTSFPFERILENISICARHRAIVIQSCFMNIRGKSPEKTEIDAYLLRLDEIKRAQGNIKLVQVYTVARQPAYGIVSSLSDVELDAIARRVRDELGIAAHAYYGAVPEGSGIMGFAPADSKIAEN